MAETPIINPSRVAPPGAPDWHAQFVWSEQRGGPGLAVRYFRLVFERTAPALAEWIHVTADSRYRLWCNGERVGSGPAKGSLVRYSFETYNLAPWLRVGRNVLAIEVRWFGENSPLSEVHSAIPGLLVQGVDSVFDTPGNWRVWQSRSVAPDTTAYIANAQEFLNHTEIFDARHEPKSWREPDCDDQNWERPVSTGPALAISARWGVTAPRTLVCRDVPPLLETPGRFTRSIMEHALVPHPFGESPVGWTIPAGLPGRILLDVGHYTTAYPLIECVGGRDREIRVVYAEALGQWVGEGAQRHWEKRGVRDDFRNAEPHGYRDTVILDGGDLSWEPFHWRAFRWLEVTVMSGSEPVTIRDVRYRACVHPQRFSAVFRSSDPQAAEIFAVSQRTFQVGAHETYDDSPYFEQFSYIADSRLEALGSLHLCNDPSLPRRTLRLFLDTLRGDGLIDARVPCQSARQTIPYFCLHWILMVEDYCQWMGQSDAPFIRECLVAVDSILTWFRSKLRPDGFVGVTGGWNMVDAYEGWPHGEPPAVTQGGSTYITCLFIEALQSAVRVHRAVGVTGDQRRWEQLAKKLTKNVSASAWDEKTGWFVEGRDHLQDRCSQHVQAAAINAGVATRAQVSAMADRLCLDPGLIRTTSMQSYYLVRALEKVGRYGELHREVLQPWRTALQQGLTTWPEYPDPSRSDSHAWAAWPAVEYVRTVLGIRPGAPGWTRVRLSPQVDGLDWAQGRAPTPAGEIDVEWSKTERTLEFRAKVPAGCWTELTLPGRPRRLFRTGGEIVVRSPLPERAHVATVRE